MEARERDVVEERAPDVTEDREEREVRPLSTADLAGRAGDSTAQESDGAREDKGGAAQEAVADTAEPLFPDEQTEAFQNRWVDIQARFVDEPRESVQAADSLVAELMSQLADGFSRVRSGLEGQWDRGDSVSTEDLRVALQRYRAFFERLLAA